MAICLISAPLLALNVTVDGYGEVPAQGLEITVTEMEQDILSGKNVMELQGTIVSSQAVRVTITRSAQGTEDEFCCAGQCIPGNGEQIDRLDFPSVGTTTWFAHYYPASATDVTMQYVFSTADEEPLTVTVHYNAAQDIEHVTDNGLRTRKVLEDGILYIIHDSKKQTIL